MGSGIALFCLVHTTSPEAQERVLALLRKGAREYYRKPEAKCTTWSYFTPFPPPKPPSSSASANTTPPIIGGLEIYTDKSALSTQVSESPEFQNYHAIVKQECLYARDEVLVAWYQVAGFIARQDHATPFGNVLISTSSFVCRDRDRVVSLIEEFAGWVEHNEPGVLTYAAFTRPKAPRELLLFVRYRDTSALRGHSTAPEHDVIVEKMSAFIENTLLQATTLWREVEDSFVSTRVGGDGGGGDPSTSKL